MIPWWGWLLIGFGSGGVVCAIVAVCATLIYIGKGMFG